MAQGGAGVGLTINAPQIRAYETGTTGTTWLGGTYKKNDSRVAKLRFRTIVNGSVVDEQYFDVSQIGVGQQIAFIVALGNGLQKVTVNADNVQTDTIPADGDKTFTAPGDHLLVIIDKDNALQVLGWPVGQGWPSSVVVFPGASVTLVNQDQVDHQVEIYSIPVSELQAPAQVGIEIAELDAANTELYTASATVEDIPPLEIVPPGQAGETNITAIA